MKRRLSLIALILCPSIFCWLATVRVAAQAQNLRATTSSSYVERGNEWHAKGEYERALADFDLAIASDPSNAIAYYNRAATQYQLKGYERALADFTSTREWSRPMWVAAWCGID